MQIHRPIPLVLLSLMFLAILVEAQDGPSKVATVDGMVLDELSGNPLVDVRVQWRAPRLGFQTATTTGKDGEFSFQAPQPGEYEVSISKAGFIASRKVGARLVNLHSGQHIKALQLRMLRSSSIMGTVLQGDRSPAISAKVVALRVYYEGAERVLRPPGTRNDWYPGASMSIEGAEAVTNNRGEYRLFGLEPGEYYLAVWENFERQSQGFIGPVQYYPGVPDVGSAVSVLLPRGVDSFRIDVELSSSSLHSTTLQAEKGGTCSLPGTPVMFHLVQRAANGLRVTVGRTIHNTSAITLPLMPIPPASPSDSPFKLLADNKWTTPGLYAGLYEIYYSPCYSNLTGPTMFGHLSLEMPDRNVNARILAVEPGGQFKGHVSLTPGALKILGSQPLAISLFDLDHESPFKLPPKNGLSSLSPYLVGKDGTFLFPTLSRGRYAIDVASVLSPTDLYISSASLSGRDVRNGFEFGSSTTGELQLNVDGPGGMVQGTTRNNAGEMVGEAMVVLIPPTSERKNRAHFKVVESDQSGQFVIRGIRPGQYGLVALDEMESGAYFNPTFLGQFETRQLRVQVQPGVPSNQTLTVIRTHP